MFLFTEQIKFIANCNEQEVLGIMYHASFSSGAPVFAMGLARNIVR
jgi:hypothetical protein